MLALRAVLAATDFSPSSDYALHLAWSLAQDHRARLVVLHVASRSAVRYGDIVAPLAEGGYKDNAWKALRRLQWPDGTVPVDLRVDQGDPAREIIRLARELSCDMIVMGTHGRTGLERLFVGSVAEQVMRKASCPVLTVKSLGFQDDDPSEESSLEENWEQHAMTPIRTILHATDFSEHAKTAFHLSCSLARDHEARLIVLHVAEPVLDYRGTASLVYGDAGGMLQATVENHKEQLKEKLRQFALPEPPVEADYEVVEGDAAEQILGYVQKTKADLVVMGTHGRTGLARLLMGSVAEQIVRRSSCPVLTLKTPFAEAQDSPEPTQGSTSR